MRQQTIKKDVKCFGVGLHSGKKVSLHMRPADEDTGLVFVHKGPDGSRKLYPTPHSVKSTELATTIGNGDVSIATVEHLLAAVAGLGIDNLYIDVQGNELPIMDGSAASFVFLLRTAGLRRQRKPRRILGLSRPLVYKNGQRWIKAEPYSGLKIKYTIDYSHPLVGNQSYQFEHNPQHFVRSLAKARTFGFLKDVEKLQSMGLALGGTLNNAVVLDEYGVINPDGLRYSDELVRHKTLDFMGDISLMGAALWGSFEVHCSGHAFNNSFLRFLDENRDDYLHWVDFDCLDQKVPAFEPQGAFQPQPAWA
ncbi:UDP-3-O-acyl-N-acetylglucosamine deacetylase [Desulfonatronospira sp.]|uniref:UDP-3-O-acyl-N-acetylglucosamine deacetylase n=1 Tax=Desulfonatronospira sp. TaxID=1962951 RepID=UPI0025BB9C86|nr:UDP-3-O-acyl-N-acetylglucosamine deacetylase [Desulfonatronospira sp.]